MSIAQRAKGACERREISYIYIDQSDRRLHVRRGGKNTRILISLEDMPVPYLVLDIDDVDCKVLVDKEKGDFMLFVDEGDAEKYVVPIEVSRGKDKKADKVISQLESCVDIAQKYVVMGDKVKYVPIFVGCSREVGILKDKHIRVNGRQQQIHILRNKERVADVLKIVRDRNE